MRIIFGSAPLEAAGLPVPRSNAARPLQATATNLHFLGLTREQKRRVLQSLAEETLPLLALDLKEKAERLKKGQPIGALPDASPVVDKNGAAVAGQFIITAASNQQYRLSAVPEGKFERVPTSSKYTTRYSQYSLERVYPETGTLPGRLHKLFKPAEYPAFKVATYSYITYVQDWIMPHDPRQTAHYGHERFHASGFELSGEIPGIGSFLEEQDWDALELNRRMQGGLSDLFKVCQDLVSARREAERKQPPVQKIKL